MNDILKDELRHAWSLNKKADYNHDYYQKHKDWWKTKYADSEIGRAKSKLNDAKSREYRAEQLRKTSFAKADKNRALANEAEKAGVFGAAKELRNTARTQASDGADYYHQREHIRNKQVNPLEGDVTRLESERELRNGGKIRPRSSVQVDKTVSAHDRGAYKYANAATEKITTKADELRRKLEWKTAPAKNKAKRKAKEFVSNWKSGAQSITSAAKSASSKVGKKFLDAKIPGVERVATIGYDHPITIRRPVTIRDAINGMKRD